MNPPLVFPLAVDVAQVWQYAFAEELDVAHGCLPAKVSELQQAHEVPDAEVFRDLTQLLRDLRRAADDISAGIGTAQRIRA